MLWILEPENCSKCHFHRNSEEACVNMGLEVKGSITVLPQGSEPTRLINHNTVFEDVFEEARDLSPG